MTYDRVMVWKFETAPQELRALHADTGQPQWVALVPASLTGPDLHESIRTQTGLLGVAVHRMESGDVVYLGSSDMKVFLDTVGANKGRRAAR